MVTTATVDVHTAMSVRQAAQRLDLSETAIRLYVRTGKLRAVKTALGLLVDRDDVEQVAQERAHASGSAIA